MTSRRIMILVLAALIPGVAAQTVFYGSGVLANLILATALGLMAESLSLKLRGRPLRPALTDGSTVVTCVLLGLALPPQTPWPVLFTAVLAAVVLAKHLYGGLGNNLFNPAMVGYAVVLVSFPLTLADWESPIDGIAGATALTAFKYRNGATVDEIWMSQTSFGAIGGLGWEWINAGFLAGGLLLVGLKLAAWRIPVALLGTVVVLSALGYDGGSSRSTGSPLFHAFSGSTMLAAFFIATDPVTHPISARGQIIYGAIVGCTLFAIRVFGNYPDGVAFAVLLGNAVTPYLDRRLVTANNTPGSHG